MTRLRPWPTVAQSPRGDFHVFRVRRVDRRSPRTGQVRAFHVLDCGDWVNVVALTPAGMVLMVRQFRHGTQDFTLEVPGGAVDPGEEPAAAALRELREETGYQGGEAVPLGWVHPNPALQGNRCHTFLVRDVRPVGEPAPDPGEDFEVVLVDPDSLATRVRCGEITHSLVIGALYLAGGALSG